MNFLNPWMLLGGLGIALPILAHLLNKHQFKQTDWAAMQFLSRAINVRSRQIKLRDFLLLVLRCLAVLLLVLAISRPIIEKSSGTIASAVTVQPYSPAASRNAGPPKSSYSPALARSDTVMMPTFIPHP